MAYIPARALEYAIRHEQLDVAFRHPKKTSAVAARHQIAFYRSGMTQLALIGILFGLCGIIGAGIALGFIRGPAEEQNYARLLQERLAGQLTRHVWKTG